MASEKRTLALLEGAGFGAVRTEEVPVRFPLGDVDEYMSVTTDTAGPIAMVLRGLTDDQRRAIKAQLKETFVPFAAGGGYEFPGVALMAVAS
ncbi:MAG: hypothetical protein ABR529_14640 [Actinomycetota bacterium]